MFQDIRSDTVESISQPLQLQSSLFDDVYNSVSSSLHMLKETVEEYPYASATLGLAVGAGMLCLTRGKLWGVASETSPFKWTNSLGLEKTIHSPKDVALIDALRRASKGPIVVLDHHPKVVNLDWLSTSTRKIDWSKELRLSVSSEQAGLNMFPQSPNAIRIVQGAKVGALAAKAGGLAAKAGELAAKAGK